MADETHVTSIAINTHPSKAVYEKLKAQGKLNDAELHLYPEDEIKEISTSEILEIWNSIMND